MSIQQPPSDSTPPVYQIVVKGQLNTCWASWFGDLSITLNHDGTTLLTGAIVDQAALFGILRKVRDAGLTLISVNRCGCREG